MRQPDKKEMSNPESMRYTADLCGTISQALKSLNGYDIMALELIQNADDAGASTLSIDVRDDALVVRNSAEFTNCGQYGEVCVWEQTGGPSDTHKSCNIHAISTMGARSKFETADQIGRFGIGFVSVFQVTDAPIIRSGNCELTLNPATPQIHPKIVPPRPDTEFELPWATCETPVRKAIDFSPVPPGIAEIVLEEILHTIGSSVLFLRNLEVVEVFRNSELAERIAIERAPNSLILHFEVSKESKHWLLLTTSAEPIIQKRRLREDYPQLQDHNRSSTVTLAVAVDEEAAEGRLFAYLPTQQSSRLPLHLNGDFYPESSRKDIVLRGRGQERQWNEALIEAAAELIGEDFGKLKEQLGPVGLWRLGKSCYEQREDEIFGHYWNEFKSAAQRNTSVLSATGVWLQPESAYFSDEASAHEASELFSLLGLGCVFYHSQSRVAAPHSVLPTSQTCQLAQSTAQIQSHCGVGQESLQESVVISVTWELISDPYRRSQNPLKPLILLEIRSGGFVDCAPCASEVHKLQHSPVHEWVPARFRDASKPHHGGLRS